MAAFLCWRLGMTYRYDNRREGIVGKNPATGAAESSPRFLPASELAG